MRNRGLLTELLGHPDRDRGRQISGWIIRARAELTCLIVLLTAYVALLKTTGWSSATVLIVETSTVVGLILLPGTRARMWAVTSRHRIYKCMYETRTMTPNGTMPYLIWASPSPVGERIRVWLPAGLSVSDLASITEALASACYATEARTEVNRRWTHLVTIIIVRRDPFTGKRLVRPGFTTIVPTKRTKGEFSPLSDRTTLPVPPAPTPPAQHPTVLAASKAAKTRGDRTTARATTSTGNSAMDTGDTHPPENTEPASPTVVGVGGTDVSDYV